MSITYAMQLPTQRTASQSRYASAALFGAEVSAPGRPWRYIIVLTLPLFFLHLRGVWTREGRALDPMLPLLVMSTFALSILWGVGSIL